MFNRTSKKGVYGINDDESDEELVKLDSNRKRKRKESDGQESDFDPNKKPRRADLDPDKMFKSGSDYDEIGISVKPPENVLKPVTTRPSNSINPRSIVKIFEQKSQENTK